MSLVLALAMLCTLVSVNSLSSVLSFGIVPRVEVRIQKKNGTQPVFRRWLATITSSFDGAKIQTFVGGAKI